MDEVYILEAGASATADVGLRGHAKVVCLPRLDLVAHRPISLLSEASGDAGDLRTVLYTAIRAAQEHGVSEHTIRFVLNGEEVTATVPAHRMLISLLRDDLGLTGTKEGCSVGVCGACSVLLDDDLISSCILPAVFVDGSTVRTVEGLARDGELTELQEAFIRHGGFQCGICTPGQLIAATALLEEVPRPTETEVRSWMMGNLCRCTGYYGIIEAVLAAAEATDAAAARPG